MNKNNTNLEEITTPITALIPGVDNVTKLRNRPMNNFHRTKLPSNRQIISIIFLVMIGMSVTVSFVSTAVAVVALPAAYTIDKTVTDVAENGPEANATNEGDVVSYRIDVINDGNIDLTNVSVNDSLIELTGPFEHYPLPLLPQSTQTFQISQEEGNGILEMGEILTYTGTYIVNQSDLNSNGGGDGFINNTATVVCDQLETKNDSAEVPVEQNPAYTIDKTVTDVGGNGPEASVAAAGDIISYQIDVTNDGNIDLTNVSVNDSLAILEEPSESLSDDGVLEVGEIWTYLENYTVTQADLNNNGGGDGFINNTATVVCDQLETENDRADVSVEQKLDYSFYKSVIAVDNGGDCIVDDAGDIIRYRIVVKNEGNVDLTNVSVDDTLTSLTGPAGDNTDHGVLNPGEIWKFYGNYTVTQEDLNSNGGGDGDIDNTAIVSCDELPNKTASIRQPISQDAYLRIYKSAIGVDNAGDNIANEAGDIIEYQIVVKNAGKIDLTGVSVSDPLISLIGPIESKSTDEVLTVGELWVYTGIYTVTQKDLNTNGGGDEYIDNTATVSCNELPNATSSIKVPLVITRVLREGTDSESNNTTVVDDETTETDENDSSDNSSNSGSSNISGISHSGSGTGTVRIISNTAKDDEVNETPVKENDTEIKPESDIKDIEETTGNEATDEPQTVNKENTDTGKSTPGFEMIYGITGLLGIFLHKRR